MKKIILGMMLVMGSLSFSSDEGSAVKLSNIFDNAANEQTQVKETSQNKLNTENSIMLSNIFGN
jgi:arginyl-tRNA synthetase